MRAFLILAAALAGVSSAAAKAPSIREATKDSLAVIAAIQAEHDIPAVSIAVFRNDRIVLAKALGTADLEARTPAEVTSLFRLGSVSKLFTAALTARMADAGLVDLDADIRTYLPEFPDKGAAITLRMLLGHQGGVRHYAEKDFNRDAPGGVIDGRVYNSTEDILALFAGDELAAAPGEKYVYSTFGYSLIGAVLEKAGGKPFKTLLHDHVTEPLKLENVVIDENLRVIPGRVGFYTLVRDFRSLPPADFGAVVNAPSINPAYKLPGGGILASASGVARFGAAFFGPGFVSEKSYAAMTTPQKTKNGESTIVGQGWRIGEDASGRRILHHAGTQEGTRAVLIVYPEQKLAVAIATNLTRRPGNIEEIAMKIADSFLGSR